MILSLLKKKNFVFLYLLFFFLVACAPKKQDGFLDLASINVIDHNGFSETINSCERLKQYENVDFLQSQPYQKVMRVYKRDEKGDVKACITSYYPNGQIKQYLDVVNNRAFGVYKEWFENGVLKLDVTVIGGNADIGRASESTWLFDDYARAWDESGNLLAEIPYSKGQLQGISVYYHPQGSVWKLIPFEKNQAEGNFEIYLSSGQLLQTTEYHQGAKNGSAFRYWRDDQIAAEETYAKGLLLKGRYYDLFGKLVAQIDEGSGFRATFSKETIHELQEYHGGVLEGEVRVFGKEGILLKVYHMKNALKHGEEIEFQERSDLKGKMFTKLSINWYEGKIQGTVKTWYDNGIQESQREMSNNSKNGLATAWYLDGNLMLLEEYDHDKLIRGEYYRKGERIPISQVTMGKGIVTLFDAEGHLIKKVNYFNGRPQL